LAIDSPLSTYELPLIIGSARTACAVILGRLRERQCPPALDYRTLNGGDLIEQLPRATVEHLTAGRDENGNGKIS
jgi:hypothetical protein